MEWSGVLVYACLASWSLLLVQEQKKVIVIAGISINAAEVTATYTTRNNMVIRGFFNSDKLFSR
jgi:hypothetical protein